MSVNLVDNASSGIKSSGDKQQDILNILDRRTTLIPKLRSSHSKIASEDILPYDVPFSVFKSKHMELAGRLMNILLAAKDFDEYLEILDDVRESENFGLFVYLLYASVHHREDTRGVFLPPIEEVAPHLYFTAETIHQAIQLSIHEPNEDHTVINQKTSSLEDDEGNLAYFREDIGVSSHHWAWHIVYPWNGTGITKDRKGELFYYMHNQMVARYNSERLANYMDRVVPLVNFHEDLTPYFAHLTSQVTGVHYGNRPPGLKMKTIESVTIQEMEIWRYRILNGIDLGYLICGEHKEISLQDDKGIDRLGAIVEASTDSVNMDFYGSLHNNGHDVIASCHDPDSKYNKQTGVMGAVNTSARDPIFYRWHKYIDDIFTRHKVTLPPYSRKELNLDGIQVLSAEVKAEGAELPNVVHTFMREALTDLSNAPFLKTDKKILVKYEQMDHEPFHFNFTIRNESVEKREVTIRVFLAPTHNVNGIAFTFPEQRRLMIELDKFQTLLEPGVNTITRQDIDSSVTLRDRNPPYRALKAGTFGGSDKPPPLDYCNCGWPQHLFIPKGRFEGMNFNLFVMATDYLLDKVIEEDDSSCKGSFSYCGSLGKKYPDSKPMGYPFDKRIVKEDGSEITDIAQLHIDNMIKTDVKIIFTEGVRKMTDWTREMYQYYD